ncbi:aldo/keto reductase [Pelagicoccus sp. SDUM812003]|uniref:aldo/keto reductase n=1 Tax=Pelagicoccus sp. SDUM812003 TaxID=3041267 RepID=UPI00280D613C|nr:aldo/keto reductase [Pelagicoccus sp. SDUM812003]MDQ8205359.1 aldo/keto reductase [Pelagicoccus sp. SDUM812003]
MSYSPAEDRYQKVEYKRCGRSGLKLPPISLGLWHNFGSVDDFDNARELVRFSFDEGITHFDLANNYGPVPGSAETNFGRILKKDFESYRDELIVSTKAGYDMWPGPYGDRGSKKYLVASLNQSLHRLGLDYVDIFYSHRPDPETPIEETVDALEYAVRSGKALYVGISNYGAEQTAAAYAELKSRGIRCLIHQPRYNMIDRRPESGLLDTLDELGMGAIVFSPLEQGILSDRYLEGIPAQSRATRNHFLSEETVRERQTLARALNEIASERGQTLAQMAIAWVLKRSTVVSALVGASSTQQIAENVKGVANTRFSDEELARIDAIIKG